MITLQPKLLRVLVVDDDPVCRMYLQRGLSRQGFEVVPAGGPDEARDLLVRGNLDAVVTDWHMPCAGGEEVIGSVRADPRTSGLPVVVVSGAVSATYRIRALRAGANDVFPKPVAVTSLGLRLRELEAAQPNAGAGRRSRVGSG